MSVVIKLRFDYGMRVIVPWFENEKRPESFSCRYRYRYRLGIDTDKVVSE